MKSTSFALTCLPQKVSEKNKIYNIMMVGDEKVSMDEGKQGTALAGRDDIGDRSPSQRVEVAEKDGSMDSQTRAFDEANQSDMVRECNVMGACDKWRAEMGIWNLVAESDAWQIGRPRPIKRMN